MKLVSHCYYFKDFTILTYIYSFYFEHIFLHFLLLSLLALILSRRTTVKIRCNFPFSAIRAISIVAHISATTNKFYFLTVFNQFLVSFFLINYLIFRSSNLWFFFYIWQNKTYLLNSKGRPGCNENTRRVVIPRQTKIYWYLGVWLPHAKANYGMSLRVISFLVLPINS